MRKLLQLSKTGFAMLYFGSVLTC